MRLVGITPDPAKADQFVAFLKSKGADSLVRSDGLGRGVWVINEDQWESAKLDWAQFEAHPELSQFQPKPPSLGSHDFASTAPSLEEMPTSGSSEPSTAAEGGIVANPVGAPTWYPATATLALAAVAVGVLTSFGDEKNDLYRALTFGPVSDNGVVGFPPALEVWRVFTPSLIHLSLVQLLFHLVILQDFGGQAESKLGRARFVLLVLFLMMMSNLAEGFLGPTRQFGGLAGPVFGLFGFTWVRAALAPKSGFRLPVSTSIILVAWFLFSLGGKMIPPSHWAHIVGFFSGVAVGLAMPATGMKEQSDVATETPPIP